MLLSSTRRGRTLHYITLHPIVSSRLLRLGTGDAGVRLLVRTPTRPLFACSTTRAGRSRHRVGRRRRRRLPPPAYRLPATRPNASTSTRIYVCMYVGVCTSTIRFVVYRAYRAYSFIRLFVYVE